MKNEEIQIKEISRDEAAEITEELSDFNPESCLMCGNEEGIVQRFFLLNVSVADEATHERVKKVLQDKYGLSYYGFSENNSFLITTGKCPECDWEKMDWDY